MKTRIGKRLADSLPLFALCHPVWPDYYGRRLPAGARYGSPPATCVLQSSRPRRPLSSRFHEGSGRDVFKHNNR